MLLLHLVGFLYYVTYIDDARSNTNQCYRDYRQLHDDITSTINSFHSQILNCFSPTFPTQESQKLASLASRLTIIFTSKFSSHSGLSQINFTRDLIKWKSQIHTHKKASNYSAIVVDKDTTCQQRPLLSHLLIQLTCRSLADILIIHTASAS